MCLVIVMEIVCSRYVTLNKNDYSNAVKKTKNIDNSNIKISKKNKNKIQVKQQ